MTGSSGWLGRLIFHTIPGRLKSFRAILLFGRLCCIQPYFVAPTVRTRIGQRRRTGKHTNPGAPGPTLWVTTQAWGRCS
jgi:hypothetical protein